MKQLEKLVGVNTADFQSIVPQLKAAGARMYKEYSAQTHPKLKMLDALIVFSILSCVVQVLYA